ncbi:MAG TPA: NAD(P)-dependent oxidoreductase [Victivallales bacterium]|nr:NAD(P)-dependent oxidoreductase [Victivallales bacterium]
MPVYPANLLITGKKCLVVGGGKVAERKIPKLLAGGASITVVAPEINPLIQKMSTSGKLRTINANFAEEYLQGQFLVFAATDDRSLNKRIIEICSSKKILSCAVDENWKQGDFISPASFEKNGISVAVSTHGKSCRRSRMIKEIISRHIEMLDDAQLVVIGTDHNHTSLNDREKIFDGKNPEHVCRMLSHIWGLHEFFLLNTCNRTELIAVASTKSKDLEDILKTILGFSLVKKESLYVKYGWEAFSHISLTMAGMKSQSVGERNISGQMKKAVSEAFEKTWAAGILRECCDSCLHISKHIRNETEKILSPIEIHDLCAKFVKSKFHPLTDKDIIVIGSGATAINFILSIDERKNRIKCFFHNSRPEKIKNVDFFPIGDLKKHINSADIIVSAISCPSPIITEKYAPLMHSKHRIVAIDLSYPRSIDPKISSMAPNLSVFDLDSLKSWQSYHIPEIRKAFRISQKILSEHRDMFEKLMHSFRGSNRSGGFEKK